jgi:hypothetical protein
MARYEIRVVKVDDKRDETVLMTTGITTTDEEVEGMEERFTQGEDIEWFHLDQMGEADMDQYEWFLEVQATVQEDMEEGR